MESDHVPEFPGRNNSDGNIPSTLDKEQAQAHGNIGVQDQMDATAAFA